MSKKLNQQFSCSQMMLPEHRSTLQEHAAQNRWYEAMQKPVLDEQEQERLQQILEEALAKKQNITVTVLEESGRNTYQGIPLRSDQATATILLSSTSGKPRLIQAADVVQLEKLDHR